MTTIAATSVTIAPPSAVTLDAIMGSGLTERLRTLRDTLLTGLVERDVAVRLALLAALSGEHLLLIGPPGTAKSLVAQRLKLAFRGAECFERLLTRFTVPEELFGPLSIKGLEEDRYERLTEGYLPSRSVAFLDEIFKANSAILNALLSLLNERVFDNGTQRVPTPLITAIGASNELPEGEELDALFDRFLLRLHVGPVSTEGFPSLLALRGQATPAVPEHLRLTGDDLRAIQAAAETVEVPADVVALLASLRDWCTAEGIEVSDRRWRKVVKLLQVSALTNESRAVSIWDCWLLQHCLWSEPEQRQKVFDWYAGRVGASAAMSPVRLTTVVSAWEANLKRDQESRSQVRDGEGNMMYLLHDGRPTISSEGDQPADRGGKPLYLAPASTVMRQDRYSSWESQRDRANGNRGYTSDELNETFLRENHEVIQFHLWQGKFAYLNDPTNRFLLPGKNAPHMEPTRHQSIYVQDRISQIHAHGDKVDAYRQELSSHIATLKDTIERHLWVMNTFLDPALTNLNHTLETVDRLRARLARVVEGCHALPREANELPTLPMEGEV